MSSSRRSRSRGSGGRGGGQERGGEGEEHQQKNLRAPTEGWGIMFQNNATSQGGLGGLLEPLGHSWGHLEWSWAVLDSYWGLLGRSWVLLGMILGLLGAVLGPLGSALRASWGALGAFLWGQKTSKSIGFCVYVEDYVFEEDKVWTEVWTELDQSRFKMGIKMGINNGHFNCGNQHNPHSVSQNNHV